MWVKNVTDGSPYATNIVDGRTLTVRRFEYTKYAAAVSIHGPYVGAFDGGDMLAWEHMLHQGTYDECVEFFILFLSLLRKADGCMELPDVSSTARTPEEMKSAIDNIPL